MRRIRECESAMSLPVRGAWIEISTVATKSFYCGSLPVRGAWIEILSNISCVVVTPSRSPCGERGLKSFLIVWYSLLI